MRKLWKNTLLVVFPVFLLLLLAAYRPGHVFAAEGNPEDNLIMLTAEEDDTDDADDPEKPLPDDPERPATEIDISDKNLVSIELSATKFDYNGSNQKPAVTVTYSAADENLLLKNNTDYTVEYQKDSQPVTSTKNAGTYTVIITGSGNYTGTVSRTFTINPRSISDADVTGYKDKTRTGKAITFSSLSVKAGGRKLIKDTDYTITYSTNKNIGMGKIKITGTGNYKNSISKTFKILPTKVTGIKNVTRTSNSIKLTWTPVKQADRYQIFVYDKTTKTWARVKTVSTNSATIKKLPSGEKLVSGTAYKFKIRAYTKSDSGTKKIHTYCGSFSSVKSTGTTPDKVTQTKTVWSSDKSIKVTWKALSRGNGYQIKYSTDKKFKSDVKSVLVSGKTKTAKTISNLDPAKTYYFKIRAYKTINNHKLYGTYSTLKAATPYSNVYAVYVSYYNPSNVNKTTNLRLSSKAIDGTILDPGATFSFNKIVGQRTKEKGYKPSAMFFGGTVAPGLGGGICQVSSTLFNAVLLGNLDIIERKQHSGKVSYAPVGRDSSISWGVQDLIFRNNTNYKMKVEIKMSDEDGVMTVRLLTNPNVKPPKVSLKVTQSGRTYTLKRTVDGKVNYTTKTVY